MATSHDQGPHPSPQHLASTSEHSNVDKRHIEGMSLRTVYPFGRMPGHGRSGSAAVRATREALHRHRALHRCPTLSAW